MLKLRLPILFALSSAALIPLHATAATTFVQWNFNSPTPDSNVTTGTDSPSVNLLSSGLTQPTITRIGGVAGGYVTANPSSPSFPTDYSSDVAPKADNSAYNTTTYPNNSGNVLLTSETAGIQVASSTVGYRNIVLSFDWLVQAGASEYWEVQYSTNGTSYTDLQALDAAAYSHWQRGVSVTLPSAVANTSTLDLRIVSAITNGAGYSKNSTLSSQNYSGTNGQVRFDVVTLSGDVLPSSVPEPASLGLLAMGAAALLIRPRASRR